MKMKLVGSVPMKPYLVKYIEKTEYLNPGQALDLSNNGAIAFVFKMLLTNKTNIKHETSITYEQMNRTYTAVLRFKISARMQVFNEFFISRKSISIFNNYVRCLFYETLMDRIRKGVGEGRNEKDIIYEFIQELDIEEDIPADTIKRAISRLRKSKKIPTIHQQKCLGA